MLGSALSSLALQAFVRSIVIARIVMVSLKRSKVLYSILLNLLMIAFVPQYSQHADVELELSALQCEFQTTQHLNPCLSY